MTTKNTPFRKTRVALATVRKHVKNKHRKKPTDAELLFSKNLKCSDCTATFYEYRWLKEHKARFHTALWA